MKLRNRNAVLALAVLLPVVIGSAAAIIVQNNRRIFEAMVAGSLIVQDTFIIDDGEFEVTPVDISQTGRTEPDMFAPADTTGFPVASNGASAGDWIKTFTIMTTDTTPSFATFQMTLTLNGVDPVTGRVTARGIIIVGGTPEIAPGVTVGIIIEYGLGASLSSPASYQLTIERVTG